MQLLLEGDRKVACPHASVSPGPLQYAGRQKKHAQIGCLGRKCVFKVASATDKRGSSQNVHSGYYPQPQMSFHFMSPLFGEHESLLHREQGTPLSYSICRSLSVAFSRCVPVHHKASGGHLHCDFPGALEGMCQLLAGERVTQFLLPITAPLHPPQEVHR